MPTFTPKLPTSPNPCVGRKDYSVRYVSRLHHYNISLFVGLPGIGKTTLLFHLAELAREKMNLETTVYLPLFPGEGISSVLARTEARILGRAGQSSESQADAYRRLTDLLDVHKTLLVLDNLHCFRHDDLVALLRTVSAYPGAYRILAGSNFEPDLSAMERSLIHVELLKQLLPEEVGKILELRQVGGELRDTLYRDAIRGGASAHPLTLHFVISLSQSSGQLPDDDFLMGLTARSQKTFQKVWETLGNSVTPEQHRIMVTLSHIGLPIETAFAKKTLGAEVDALIKLRFIEENDGAIGLARTVRKLLEKSALEIDQRACRSIAEHLSERAVVLGEPMAILRAGELLAHAGDAELALNTFSSGWEAVRDFGFSQAYLKSLASIPVSNVDQDRVRVLSARARMRQGNPSSVRAEIEELAKSSDSWAVARSLAALTYIYDYESNSKKVVQAFKSLEKLVDSNDSILFSGPLAANAMVKLGKLNEAEKLAKRLLELLDGSGQFDRQGDMHRLIARISSQAGHLKDATHHAIEAARSFEQAGDLYYCAIAWGYVGDLQREAGEFEVAKGSFSKFQHYATEWGDRNLIQIAKLATAWVSLDIGDLSHASKQIAEIEKDIGAAPSSRLRRYLKAAKVVLEAGRGRHSTAVEELPEMIESWDAAGQNSIADILRSQLVRSLIASGDIGSAETIVGTALERLGEKTAGPRRAVFLRESALIRLRRHENELAMEELNKACKLFVKAGNRREEVLTLHRIAHAGLDQGDIELADERAKQALSLAKRIKHERAIALAKEVSARIAMVNEDFERALEHGREAFTSLRKLGDDRGTLHVSELLLRIYLASGDVGSALTMGPKVKSYAERVGMTDMRVRAVALTGVAAFRRGNLEAASRCFRELPEGALSPLTSAMMWRLGEAIAFASQNRKRRLAYQRSWTQELNRLPSELQDLAIQVLVHLAIQPRERMIYLFEEDEYQISFEEAVMLDGNDYAAIVDAVRGCVTVGNTVHALKSHLQRAILARLTFSDGKLIPKATLLEEINEDLEEEIDAKALDKAFNELSELLSDVSVVKFEGKKTGYKAKLGKNIVRLLPILVADPDLSDEQISLIKFFQARHQGTIQDVTDSTTLSRAVARRELQHLNECGYVEVVKEGRSQIYRLR